jgi:hypothetical protein
VVSGEDPRFGVIAEVFHGIGPPFMGMPLITRCAPPGVGPKMMTSYFERRSSILRSF